MSPTARTPKRTPKSVRTEAFGQRRPLGHEAVIERLFGAALAERLPHALLFEGPEGTGKFTAMAWLASGLLCAEGPGPPCGSCGPCKRVRSGNHPDLFVVDPIGEGEEKLRVIRIAYRPDAPNNPNPEDCVESFLNLRAVEASRRPVLLRDVHRMNAAAQNALLKTLEEPRPGVILMLETHRTDLLLDTILSRCVRLRSGSLSRAEGCRVLEEQGLDPERAQRLARWTDGSVGQALALVARGGEEALECLVQVLEGRLDPVVGAGRLGEIKGAFVGGTASAKARDRARVVLDLALALARDGHRLEVGARPEDLAFGTELVTAQQVRGTLPRPWAARLEVLLTCRADVDRNVGPDALFERGLMALSG